MKYTEPRLTDLNSFSLQAYGDCATGTTATAPTCVTGDTPVNTTCTPGATARDAAGGCNPGLAAQSTCTAGGGNTPLSVIPQCANGSAVTAGRCVTGTTASVVLGPACTSGVAA